MKTLLRSRLVLGSTFLALLGGIVYACSNFLDTPAQGTLDQNALLTKTGVEGSLIAAYRILDCTSRSARGAAPPATGCSATSRRTTRIRARKRATSPARRRSSSTPGTVARPPTPSTRNGPRGPRAGPVAHFWPD